MDFLDDPLVRVRYFDGQHLTPAELADEQAYHRSLARSHNLAAHGPGVLAGMGIRFDAEARHFVVDPGLAIGPHGGNGRLRDQFQIPLRQFDERRSDQLDVYLDFLEDATAPGASNQTGRCPPRIVAGARIRETVRPTVWPVNSPTPQQPEPPRIFLGRIVRDFGNPDEPYRVDLRGRQHARLVGARIEAPSTLARVELGDHPGRPFRVVTRTLAQARAGDELETNFEIDEQGEFVCHRDATVAGDLRIERGYLVFETVPEALLETPAAQQFREAAHPWNVYRARGHRLEEDANGQLVPEPDERQQLRIELPAGPPGGDLVVGSVPEEGKEMQPALTVSSDGTVRVHGDLVVEKGILERDAPPLGEAARDRLFGGVLFRPEAAAELIATFNASGLRNIPEQIEALVDNDGNLNALVGVLADDRFARFLLIVAGLVAHASTDAAEERDLQKLLLERDDTRDALADVLDTESTLSSQLDATRDPAQLAASIPAAAFAAVVAALAGSADGRLALQAELDAIIVDSAALSEASRALFANFGPGAANTPEQVAEALFNADQSTDHDWSEKIANRILDLAGP